MSETTISPHAQHITNSLKKSNELIFSLKGTSYIKQILLEQLSLNELFWQIVSKTFRICEHIEELSEYLGCWKFCSAVLNALDV